MNILLIGMGEVGRHLAGTLSYKGHPVVAVDSNPLSLELATEHADLMTFNGHGSAPATLRECGAHNADLVIAVTDSYFAQMVPNQRGVIQSRLVGFFFQYFPFRLRQTHPQ